MDKINLVTGGWYRDGYGRLVHIMGEDPFDEEGGLMIGILKIKSRHCCIRYLPDGHAYAERAPENHLTAEVPSDQLGDQVKGGS